jgi:hypothetical protein
MFVVGNANVSSERNTDSDGAFLVGVNHGAGVESFGLTVKCKGYRDDRRTVFAFDDYDYRIVLERESEIVDSSDTDNKTAANQRMHVRTGNG